MQHVNKNAEGVEVKTDVDVLTDVDCITMDDGDLRSGVKKMIDDRIGEVIDGAPEQLDTLKEIATELEKNQSGVSTILNKLETKIEKEDLKQYARKNDITLISKRLSGISTSLSRKVENINGKGLSTNDFTDVDKQKLDAIEDGAQKNKVTSVNGKTGDVTIEAGNVDLSGYVKTTDIADFKRCIVLSSDAYSKLSDTEKNRADTLYFLL